MTNNICRFIPHHKDYDSIHTINFVLETEYRPYTELSSQSVYKVHYVLSGNGTLHTVGKTQSLKTGDLFFTFPGYSYSIESREDFTYMYISFLGNRANMLMEQMKISPSNNLLTDCSEVYEYWKNGIHMSSDFSDLISESVLLYTFAYLGKKLCAPALKEKNSSDTVLMIKKYVDERFADKEFSLKSISRELCYNPKYISALFKKSMGVGISEYLNTIRIQQACTLMEQGFTAICDIASCCGYSDPQYFSKIFKQRTGYTPTEYKSKL